MPWLGVESARELKSVFPILVLALTDGLNIRWMSPENTRWTPPVATVTGNDEFPPIPDDLRLGWLLPCYYVGLPAGCVFAAVAFSLFGRRLTISFAPAMYTVSALLHYFAPAADCVLAAGVLAGVALSVSLSFSSIYVAEVSSRTARGTMILLSMALSYGGSVLQSRVAPYVTFEQQALLTVPPLLLCGAGIVLWMEESPFYLAAAEREDAVADVLARLRVTATPDGVRQEASSILASVRQQKSVSTTWRQTQAAMVVFVLSAGNVLWGYTSRLELLEIVFRIPVLVDAKGIVLMITEAWAIVLAVTVVGRSARRPYLLGSLLANSLCMLGMSAFFLVKTNQDLPGWTSYLPIALLFCFVFSHCLGGMSVPHILMAELLSMRLKAFVAPLSVCVMYGASLALNSIQSCLLTDNNYGIWLPLGIFAFTNLFGAVFVLAMMVPETKGETLVDVQNGLSQR